MEKIWIACGAHPAEPYGHRWNRRCTRPPRASRAFQNAKLLRVRSTAGTGIFGECRRGRLRINFPGRPPARRNAGRQAEAYRLNRNQCEAERVQQEPVARAGSHAADLCGVRDRARPPSFSRFANICWAGSVSRKQSGCFFPLPLTSGRLLVSSRASSAEHSAQSRCYGPLYSVSHVPFFFFFSTA